MRLTTIALVLLFASGCLKQLALKSVADGIAEPGDGFSRDDDPELVRDSLPVLLKSMESLHDSLPQHRGLLLALARGFTSLGAGFVEEDADRVAEKDVAAARVEYARARRLFLRARNYGLDALEILAPGARNAFLNGNAADREAVLARIKREDVALLYWTAAAWGSAVSVSKDNMKLVGELPRVEQLMKRGLALDEAYDEGALHEFYVTWDAAHDDLAGAKQNFDRARALSKGKKLSVLVTYVEAVDIPKQNKKEFLDLLNQAIAFDLDSDPPHRLVNTISQRRAQWLLGRADDLFAE